MIEPVKEKVTKAYHGTRNDVANDILKWWFKVSSELNEWAYKWWGYDAIQDVVSFALDKKTAKTFANVSRDWAILESKIKEWANIVKMNWIEYAEELSDYITELRNRWVDWVILDNWENELVVINRDIIWNTKKL
jgi:hypothetical protein